MKRRIKAERKGKDKTEKEASKCNSSANNGSQQVSCKQMEDNLDEKVCVQCMTIFMF